MSSKASRGLRALGAAVGLAIGGVATGFGATAVVAVVIGLFGVDLSLGATFVLTFVVGAIGFVAFAGAYLRYRGLGLASVGLDTPSLRDLLWVASGYVVTFLLVFLAALVLTVLQVQPDTANQAAQTGMENPDLLLWLVPISLFVVAPAEEYLFRGVIQSRLRETFMPIVAIPVTAAIFAAIHFFSLTGGAGGRLIAIAVLFFPSLVFGTVYEKTGNLVAPILLHGIYNSTLVLMIYAALEYADAPAALL